MEERLVVCEGRGELREGGVSEGTALEGEELHAVWEDVCVCVCGRVCVCVCVLCVHLL